MFAPKRDELDDRRRIRALKRDPIFGLNYRHNQDADNAYYPVEHSKPSGATIVMPPMVGEWRANEFEDLPTWMKRILETKADAIYKEIYTEKRRVIENIAAPYQQTAWNKREMKWFSHTFLGSLLLNFQAADNGLMANGTPDVFAPVREMSLKNNNSTLMVVLHYLLASLDGQAKIYHRLGINNMEKMIKEFQRHFKPLATYMSLIFNPHNGALNDVNDQAKFMNIEHNVTTTLYRELERQKNIPLSFMHIYLLNIDTIHDREVACNTFMFYVAKGLIRDEPLNASVRSAHADKQQRTALETPYEIREDDIVDAAHVMGESIANFREGDDTPLTTAIKTLFLQLVTGSRMSGVLFTNKIKKPISKQNAFGAPQEFMITMHGLSKMWNKDKQIAKRFSYIKQHNRHINDDDALSMATDFVNKNSITQITKPLLSPLFPGRLLKKYDSHFDTVKQLLDDVRKFVVSRLVEVVDQTEEGALWDDIESGEISIQKYPLAAKKVKNAIRNECKAFFRVFPVPTTKPHLADSVLTHEMRKLYVCYGYYLYGGRMKEVEFARAVTGHKDYASGFVYMNKNIA